MLEYLDFEKIDNIESISKNCEVTKGRLRVQWEKITSNEQEDDFCNTYFLKRLVINVKLKDGKAPLRLVAALAKELSINPYWITCDSNNFSEYSEEKLHDFLLEHGYDSEKPPETKESKADIQNISTEASSDPSKAASDSGEAKDKEAVQNSSKPRITHENPYVETLRTRIEQKIMEISSDDLGKIEAINEKYATELLKSLYLRAEYDEEIKRIATIVKLAMLL